MSSSPTPVPVTKQVGILVLDNDPSGQGALRQILDSEGWRVRIVPDTKLLLAELKTGEWSLVVANVALIGIDSPLFVTLRELSSVSVADGGRLRVLYILPELSGGHYVSALESAKLPYVVRPFHLHDFLEKVSDLLVEVKAIEAPLRQVRHEFGQIQKKKRQAGRSNSMFAARDSFSYTDEELPSTKSRNPTPPKPAAIASAPTSAIPAPADSSQLSVRTDTPCKNYQLTIVNRFGNIFPFRNPCSAACCAPACPVVHIHVSVFSSNSVTSVNEYLKRSNKTRISHTPNTNKSNALRTLLLFPKWESRNALIRNNLLTLAQIQGGGLFPQKITTSEKRTADGSSRASASARPARSTPAAPA